MKTKLPNFICVGAQKSGTTTLHDLLKKHPAIYLPKIKETKFFRDIEKYNQGIDYYKNTFFSNIDNETVIGEIDPEYIYFSDIPQRIYTTLGKDIKLIFIFRNPASRAFSHYQMSIRRGLETLSFTQALNNESMRLDKGLFEKNHFSYIDRGYYAKQVENFLKYFPIENMLFLRFEEDLLNNQNLTLQKIYNFLNINMYETALTIKSNSATSAKYPFLNKLLFKKSIFKTIIRYFFPSKKLRNKLADYIYKKNTLSKTEKNSLSKTEKNSLIKKYFIEDIKQLEKITQINLSSWYKE